MDHTEPDKDGKSTNSPMQLPMFHYKSLQWHDDQTVRFKPATSVTVIGPERLMHKLGGYVFPIAIDSNAPPPFYRPGQTMLAAMVCQIDACMDCNPTVKMKYLKDYVQWKVEGIPTGMPIVHRVHVGRTADGSLVFHYESGKMPGYLVNPPTEYKVLEIGFACSNGRVEQDSVCKVVVCQKGGCEACG